MKEKRILLVCKGNICRSPLAHGLLDKKIKQKGLPWTIDSAGTGHWHIGKLPDSRSIKVASENGLDITYQRARQFSISDFQSFDTIYVMDNMNYEKVRAMTEVQSEKDKVDLIMNQLRPGSDDNVPDPFHDGEENFYHVYTTLDEVTSHMVESA